MGTVLFYLAIILSLNTLTVVGQVSPASRVPADLALKIANDSSLSSGINIVKAQVGDRILTAKLVLQK